MNLIKGCLVLPINAACFYIVLVQREQRREEALTHTLHFLRKTTAVWKQHAVHSLAISLTLTQWRTAWSVEHLNLTADKFNNFFLCLCASNCAMAAWCYKRSASFTWENSFKEFFNRSTIKEKLLHIWGSSSHEFWSICSVISRNDGALFHSEKKKIRKSPI